MQRPVQCDTDKQERLIATYKETKDRLDRGQVADADKDKLKEAVRVLKEQLDRAKAAAREGTSIAQGCVTARENVQKFETRRPARPIINDETGGEREMTGW